MAAALPPILSPPLSYASILEGQGNQRSSPRTEKKSFSNILSGKGDFPIRPVSSYKGEPAVLFSKEDIEVLASPFKYALVGKFGFNSRPLMVKIRKLFVGLGLKNLISVGLLHDSFILVHVGSEEDYSRLLLRAIWYIEGKAMKLVKWTPTFTPFEDSPMVPVWIGLPGLPLHFFNRSALFSIVSAIGSPLKSDEPTASLTRPSVARICVELDVSKDWPTRVWLGEEKVDFWLEIIVENPPLFCSNCKILGHEMKECFKLHPQLLEEKKKKQEQERNQDDLNKNLKTKNKEVQLVVEQSGYNRGKEKGKEKLNENKKNENGGVSLSVFQKGNTSEIWKKKSESKSSAVNGEGWTMVAKKQKPYAIIPPVNEAAKDSAVSEKTVPEVVVQESCHAAVCQDAARQGAGSCPPIAANVHSEAANTSRVSDLNLASSGSCLKAEMAAQFQQSKIQPLDIESKIQPSDQLVVSEESLVPVLEMGRGSAALQF